MSNYELYNKVLSTVNEDEGTFNAAARNWVEGAEDAPFEDEEAKELFAEARILCMNWRNKAINGRVSKIRMIDRIRKIAEKNLPNPYPEAAEEKPVVQELETPVHVLGVVPEKVIEEPVKEKAEEPKEEKHFFGKRKNR